MLRLVCKKSDRKMLKHSLYYGDYEWIKTNRLWVWKSILKVEKKLSIVKILNNIDKLENHKDDELIRLDVQRSY